MKCLQIKFFLGSMAVENSRSERDCVEAGQLFGEKAALKACMDRLDIQRLAEKVRKGVYECIADGRVFGKAPSRILALELHVKS